MIGELLEWAGVPGRFAILVSVVIGAWHFRNALQIAALGMLAVKVALVFVVLGVVGATGVVPGFRVHIAPNALWGVAEGVWRLVWSLLPV